MGLFINEKGHPNVFKNNEDIKNRNQEHFKIDPLVEWIKEQKEATESANRQLNVMKNLLKEQKNAQSNQMRSIRNQLLELRENDFRRESFEKDAKKSFSTLEEKNRMFLENVRHQRNLNRDFNEQVNDIRQSNYEIANRLETITTANEEVLLKMNEQMDHQQQISEQISKHGDVQKDVIGRLDNQEGLLEKVVRQLDNLRTILYERTNFLTGKIEGSNSMTSTFISKLLNGQEQNPARFMVNQKQEEKKKSTE